MPDTTPAAAPAASPAPAAAATPAATPAAVVTPVAPAVAPAAKPASDSSPAPAAAVEAKPAAKVDAPGVPKDGDLLGEPKPEAKDGEKPAEAKDGEKPAEPAPIDPKSYEFKYPEGVKADPTIEAPAREFFAANKYTPEQAQAAVDFWNTHTKSVTEQASKQIFDQWRTTQEQWQAEVKADPRIGGDKLPATLKSINDGIRQALGEDATKFFAAMKFTGFANNPEAIRGFERIFRSRTEGGIVTGHAPKTASKTLAERFYPKASQGE